MEKLNVTVENGVKTLEIRSGEASKPKDYKSVTVEGDLSVPLRFLENPHSRFSVEDSRVEVDYEEGTIKLIVSENWDPTEYYTGALSKTNEAKNLGINTGKSYTTFELADFIKMNRSLFETKDAAMQLVSQLRNFKAKVEKDIELLRDDRGNSALKRVQAVESNIPESFKVHMNIFKGGAKVLLNVEVAIDPQDLSCSLISPDLADYEKEEKQESLNAVIENIKKLYPELRIFNI